MSRFTSDIKYLRQYVNGELSPAEMYEIERAMHEDEMLMDIIEGLEHEKMQGYPNPIADLQSQIKSRAVKENTTPLFTFKKLAIAASVMVVLSAAAIYFFTPRMDVELANTVIKPDEVPTEIQNNSDVALDSSWIAHAEQVEQSQGMTAAMSSPQSKTPAVVPSKKIDPQTLIVYEAKPKLPVVIEGSKKFDLPQQEIIQTNEGRQSQMPQTELLTSRAVAARQPTPSTTSVAKSQADLQRMNLDPKTKADLMNILAKQSQEEKTEVTEKLTENTISDILFNGNSLANRKTEESITRSSTASENILPKTIQNGNPTVGWKAFHQYISEQLQKRGFVHYSANISFDLDKAMKPTHIEIKTSSDANLNNHILEILKKGPTWENKDPNHPIFIRIDSANNKN